MATTLTANFSNQLSWEVVMTGLTSSSTSPTFIGKHFPGMSYVVTGTWSTSATTSLQLQGSNDGVNFVNIGSPLTGSGAITPTGGGISVIYSVYQWVASGGDSGTSINADVRFSQYSP